MISLSRELGPLWPKLDHLPPLGLPCGMPSPPLYVFPFFLDLFLHLSFFKTYFFSRGYSHWERY